MSCKKSLVEHVKNKIEEESIEAEERERQQTEMLVSLLNEACGYDCSGVFSIARLTLCRRPSRLVFQKYCYGPCIVSADRYDAIDDISPGSINSSKWFYSTGASIALGIEHHTESYMPQIQRLSHGGSHVSVMQALEDYIAHEVE